MDNICCLTDAIDHIKEIFSKFENQKIIRWYRGISNCEHKLQPYVFREQNKYAEENIINYLRMTRSKELIGKSALEILGILQHYQAPTRLLDWSNNILVALYFACSGNLEKNGILYILDPIKLNELSEHQDSNRVNGLYDDNSRDVIVRSILAMSSDLNDFSYRLSRLGITDDYIEKISESINNKYRKSVAIQAPLSNDRIVVQQGAFTLQGGKKGDMWDENDHPIFLDDDNNKKKYLSSVIIPSNHKEEIINELNYVSINKRTMFPELEYTNIYLFKEQDLTYCI